MRLPRVLLLPVLLSTAATFGCGHVRHHWEKLRYPVNSVDDLGAPRVAVIAAAPWATFRDRIQPKFDLTAKAALQEVVPITALQQSQRLEGLRVGGRAALPTTPAGATEPQPGDLSTVDDSASAVGERTAGALPLPKDFLNTPTAIDPMLRYWAATALYQEVQLLNSYVTSAVQRKGWDAHVVRLQIAVMPKRRNAPYDTFVNLSFFSEPKRDCIHPEIPMVVPLLVTDNLAATLHASSARQVRDLALALQGMIQGIGLGLDVDRFTEQIDAVVTRDLDSRLTVARLTDSTVRVRIGALRQGRGDDGGYTQVARTQNVTFLVMTDPEALSDTRTGTGSACKGAGASHPRLSVQIDSIYSHVRTGQDLRDKSDARDRRDLEKIRKFHELAPTGAQAYMQDAWVAVHNRSWNDFRTALYDACDDDDRSECENAYPQIWHDLAVLDQDYQEQTLRYDLPFPEKVAFPVQEALLLDDGASSTSLRLSGGHGYAGDELCAQLDIEGVKLPATAIEVSEDLRTTTLRFPSLALWGLHTRVDPEKSVLYLAHGSRHEPGACATALADTTQSKRSTHVRYLLAKKDKKDVPAFSLTGVTGVIIVKPDGTALARLLVKPATAKPAKKAVLQVKLGDVTAATLGDAAVKHEGSTLEIDIPKKQAVLELTLANVKPKTKLRIEGKDDGGRAHEPVEIAIEQIPSGGDK